MRRSLTLKAAALRPRQAPHRDGDRALRLKGVGAARIGLVCPVERDLLRPGVLEGAVAARPEGAARDRRVGGRDAVVEAHPVRADVAAGEPVAEAVLELEASASAQEQPHARIADPVHGGSRPAAGSTASPDLVLLERVEDDVGLLRHVHAERGEARVDVVARRDRLHAPAPGARAAPVHARRRRRTVLAVVDRVAAGRHRGHAPERLAGRAAEAGVAIARSSGRASQIRRTARC